MFHVRCSTSPGLGEYRYLILCGQAAADDGAEVFIGSSDSGKLWTDLKPEESAQKLQEKAATLPTARVGFTLDAAKNYLYAIHNPYVTGQTIVVDGGVSLT